MTGHFSLTPRFSRVFGRAVGRFRRKRLSPLCGALGERALPRVSRLVAGLLLLTALLFPASLFAQAPTNAAAPTNAVPHPAVPPLPPALTLPASGKSPVALFRELLAMSFFERVQALTNRTPEARKEILAKLREYETLKPDDRELRLKVTELRWYLYPLLRAPLTNRPTLLARIPAEDRKLVEDRLAEWDKLSPEAQKELLQNETVIRVITQVPAGTNTPGRPLLVERRVQQWQALPEEKRQKLVEQFRSYFQLSPTEQEKVLHTLSDAERRQIEKTLDKFAQLTPLQRRQCINSFEKLANLSPAERAQFLKNAERWALMTPAEQQKWRDLVNVAPTLPAGADTPPKPPRPFLPPGKRVTPSVATNGG